MILSAAMMLRYSFDRPRTGRADRERHQESVEERTAHRRHMTTRLRARRQPRNARRRPESTVIAGEPGLPTWTNFGISEIDRCGHFGSSLDV
jgi:hypothetical protein